MQSTSPAAFHSLALSSETKMRFLLAIGLLVLAVAEAHHSHEHTLRGSRFSIGKVHVYDVELNVTAGVRGLSSQVSKSAFKAELHVYAKSGKEHIIRITKVYTSGAVKAAENKDGYVPMEKDRELEDKLSTPIKFNMENGKVISYTLSPNESLESKKIKKALLRSLEMHVPEAALQQMESSNPSLRIPVTYNTTKDLGLGLHTTHYLITVSPDVEFPYDSNVYNVSRSENFEGEKYHNYKFHHNFRQQGCSDVCNMDRSSNKYGAGCPAGYEPHHSPMKTYVHHQHHLALEYGVMTPEIIKTTEVHTADMYDQDMEVLIRQYIRKIGHSRNPIEEPTGQTTYTNLEDQEPEIDEIEIDAKCEYKSPREATETAKTLLKEIARIVVRGELESTESTIVGEKIILLKSALSKLKVPELKLVAADIIRKESLKTATEEEKAKRQIWIDMLPLIGTSDSVTFIVNYIKENIERELFVWEAKEILEALPQNIHVPSEKIIRELRTLLTLPTTRSNHLLLSATHSCLARVISSTCTGTEFVSSKQILKSPRSFKSLEQSSPYHKVECPLELVSEIVKEISDKLKNTKKQDEVIIYVENLIRTGVLEVLPTITQYVYGTAENIQEFSPSYIDFVKTAALYSLHSIAPKHPEEVLTLVMPVYFNETEIPKIRTAAFGVLIRCQPSLETLQHIAIRSWTEQSNEVGSYVTSTLDTFGNSTLPCMQLTAHRIRQVMPMMKRFDIGIQHAKNMLWSYFDDIRMFGLKGHLSYTPSNASIIPSAFYQSLSYSTDSMTDSIIETALNIEGLTQRKIFRYIDQHILGIFPAETIPSSKENEIFGEAKVIERIPETLRFTLYKRMFYSSSFYYFDLSNLKPQIDTLKEYLSAYLMKTSFDYSGHLVKVFLPSSFHTVTIAKTLPFPVEFQMHQPVVLALKIESKKRNPSVPNFHFLIRPSVYLTKLFTNQLKNLGDCKEVGVYHEHKIAISYPIQVKFQVQSVTNVNITYKLPELPKKILYYHTEAGTYAGKKSLETLPSSEERQPISTLPSPFKNSTMIYSVGVPPLHIETHTEDIALLTTYLPNTPMELVDFAAKRILNAGWRYKAVNLTIEDNSRVWPKDTEVTFNIHYNRNHFSWRPLKMSGEQESSQWPEFKDLPDDEWIPTMPVSDDDTSTTESAPLRWFWNKKDEEVVEDWSRDLKPDDVLKNRNPSIFVDQARRVSSKLSSRIPHITHVLDVTIETRPVHSKAYIRTEYNHTYTRSLHAAHLDAAIQLPNDPNVQKISIDHLMGFSRKPDEFHYDTHNDDQIALFVTALRSHPVSCSCPWKDIEVVAKGVFSYESLDTLLNRELLKSIDHKYYLSEQHNQCLEDVRNGYPLSMNCVKAMRERSIYNKLRMSILWNRIIPENIKNWARIVDTYIKHIYYNHMSINYKPHTQNKIHISLNHINKFTDEPVFDVTIEKPHEMVTLRRMRAFDDPLSSIYDLFGVDVMDLTNNTYPPTCVMMEKYLQTYDLKSYPLSLEKCNYILSTHCTDYKNFAITAKILSIDGTKEIHIHVGQHTLVLSPISGNHYTVKYDGQDYTIKEAVVFDENSAEIYVYPETYASGHKHLEVVAQKAGIKVKYTGKNVKIQIDPRYKGETCGLCSEFDGEIIREFRGIDKCLYSHPVDFVNSAITNQDTCKKQSLYPHVCEEDIAKIWRKSSAEYEPTLKRNSIVEKHDEICFSVRPLPVCEGDATPTRTEPLLVGFHCLPKHDITARRMVSEAKRRALGEVENKSVDYEENVRVARMCTRPQF